MENQTRQPALIIYNDGTAEQLIPVSIAFYEQAARGLGSHAERLKQQMVVNPPQSAPPETVEDDVDTA